MIPFREVLNPRDHDHVRLILNSSISVSKEDFTTLSRVNEFLRDDTFVAEEAVERFRGQPQGDRERLISELIWRITCHLDRSITRVLGVHAYPLGRDFLAVQSEKDERDIFCLTVAE
jgi:hypothetical protein